MRCAGFSWRCLLVIVRSASHSTPPTPPPARAPRAHAVGGLASTPVSELGRDGKGERGCPGRGWAGEKGTGSGVFCTLPQPLLDPCPGAEVLCGEGQRGGGASALGTCSPLAGLPSPSLGPPAPPPLPSPGHDHLLSSTQRSHEGISDFPLTKVQLETAG